MSAIFAMMAIASAYAGPNCTCRYKGEDIPQGQTACLKTADGTSLARCEMVLNNTSWTILNQPCPTATIGTLGERQLAALPAADNQASRRQ